jgi:hypothetical protein
MRRPWRELKLMLAIAVAAVGCSSREIVMKPPKHPEEIAVPPPEDGKFSKPPEYPAGTLNQGDPALAQGGGRGGRGGPGGPGGMPNMGAMGGGMGGMGGMPGSMPGSAGGMGMGR